MGKAMLRVAVVMAVLLALSTAAIADLSLNYEGSMKLPRPSINEYYAQGAAYVPHGTPRLPGSSVTGPTLLVYYGWQGHTFEYGSLPGLSLTAAQLAAAPTAVEIPTSSGGTQYWKSMALQNVDTAGNIWDSLSTVSTSTSAMYSDPGAHMMGASSLSPNYKIQESGWAGGYARRGAQRLGDGAGANLPTDGSLDGATFVMCRQLYNGPAYTIAVYNSVRNGDGGNMVSTELYRFDTGSWPANWQVNYVRDTSDAEYYLMWQEGGHTGDSFLIDVYDPSTSGAGATPSQPPLDIGPAIAGGAGWLAGGSKVAYLAVDWPTNQLYVLEQSGHDARVHVFTLQGPVAAPIPEPAGLGLVGLAVLGLKRRRS